MNALYELIVIGAGPAGLSAALEAWNKGLRKILVVERAKEAGGILMQCIHNGFGLHYFKEELTGPEYAGRFVEMVKNTGIEIKLDTMVLEITQERQVHTVNTQDGYCIYDAKSIVLAMGCRERTRGAIGTPGTRPAGIFTAGTAQRLLNCEGFMVGKRVLILGSGDIGLIMARRMTLEGAKVLACVEIMPYSGGLTRNIVQCLEDFNIPLYLGHSIVDIKGDKRVEKAVVMKLDENRKPIPGTEMEFDVDTILLSVGLIPENELTQKAEISMDMRTKGAVVFENRETSLPGVFACGNAVHVHDLVDFVTEEGQIAGRGAAEFVLNGRKDDDSDDVVELVNGNDVGYTVPQKIRKNSFEGKVGVYFRVRSVHKEAALITVKSGDREIYSVKRMHLAPGEMERIDLTPALLSDVSGQLTVSVEPVKA
ncbi:MAG: FAD-dependent oxidoreductase [Treponema sp.]|nr:FAD-dependent oxidoreductase [Treponema sp.]MDY2925178.1 FAD-dependent oxidoreductase [Treponema sp.]